MSVLRFWDTFVEKIILKQHFSQDLVFVCEIWAGSAGGYERFNNASSCLALAAVAVVFVLAVVSGRGRSSSCGASSVAASHCALLLFVRVLNLAFVRLLFAAGDGGWLARGCSRVTPHNSVYVQCAAKNCSHHRRKSWNFFFFLTFRLPKSCSFFFFF